MIKLLIVEDEQPVRHGIASFIDWRGHDIEICGLAGNGEEGLRLMEICRPELVLSDIHMPLMGGLRMIEEAKSRGYEFESMILTGYSDFEYAKQGIKLGVSDYIMKPVLPQEILSTVLKIKEKLAQKKDRDTVLSELKQNLYQNQSMAKEQILSQWVHYSRKPLEHRERIMEEVHMGIAPSPIQIGKIQLEGLPALSYSEGELEVLRYAVGNIIHETLAPYYDGKLETFRTGEELLWIGSDAERRTGPELRPALREVQQNCRQYLRLELSIGVSSLHGHIDEMAAAYSEASKALERRFHEGLGEIYFPAPEEEGQPQTTLLNDTRAFQLQHEILDDLRNGKFSESLDKLEPWLHYLKSHVSYGRQEIHWIATGFILELKKLTQHNTVSTFEWKDTMVNWVEQTPHVQTFDELATILQRIIQHVIENMKQSAPLHRTVQLTLDLIHSRYHTNLTLELVAKEVFVSSGYLSVLFKQEMGVNFLDYLHQHRIEHAKKLFRDNHKVYTVAAMVGYQDERHFSTTFKKWTGLPPTLYIKQLRNRSE